MSAVPAAARLRRVAGYDERRLLRGFEHVNRYWDPHLGQVAVKILPGEYYVTCQDEAVVTVLGSCVSACIRDRVAGIGGMNHFMLPDGTPGERDAWAFTAGRAARYGSDAMEHLVNTILKAGGERRHLEVKVFGGGRVLPQMTDVGRRNVEFVHKYLATEGFDVVSEDLGDVYPRHVQYFPATGKARVKQLRRMNNGTIIDRERGYREKLEHDPVHGDVELF